MMIFDYQSVELVLRQRRAEAARRRRHQVAALFRRRDRSDRR